MSERVGRPAPNTEFSGQLAVPENSALEVRQQTEARRVQVVDLRCSAAGAPVPCRGDGV